MKVVQVWCPVFHVLKQSLVSSKGLQHLNCSSIAIVWEKQHVNADEIRWIRQLWSKPHWFTRVWFGCGSVLAAGVKSMITLYVLIHGSGCLSLHGYQSCHIVRISVCWLLVCFWLTYTNIYSTFIPADAPCEVCTVLPWTFFLFPLGLISFHVLESSDYHSQSSSQNYWSFLTLSTYVQLKDMLTINEQLEQEKPLLHAGDLTSSLHIFQGTPGISETLPSL